MIAPVLRLIHNEIEAEVAGDLDSLVDAVTDPYRLQGIKRRIVVEERDGQWTAWFEHRPELVYGGSTPTEAFFRITGEENCLE